MSELRLKKFDMRWIEDNSRVMMIGKTNTGKSFLIRDLLFYNRDLPIGTVISPTEESTGFFKKMVPKMFIHYEYEPRIIENFVNRQKSICKKFLNKNDVDCRGFLILDDCMYDESWQKDKNIRYCFMNGRHNKIFFILTSQYAMGIPPKLRAQLDYIFLLRENIYANRKRLYEQYAGMFPTFDSFCQVFEQCTENYECLVINNKTQSNKIEDQIFWYKADQHDEFKIGNQQFWEMNYSSDEDSESDHEFDYDNFRKKKGPTVDVKKIDW